MSEPAQDKRLIGGRRYRVRVWVPENLGADGSRDAKLEEEPKS